MQCVDSSRTGKKKCIKVAHLAINYDPLVAHSTIHKHSLFVSGASLKIIIVKLRQGSGKEGQGRARDGP